MMVRGSFEKKLNYRQLGIGTNVDSETLRDSATLTVEQLQHGWDAKYLE